MTNDKKSSTAKGANKNKLDKVKKKMLANRAQTTKRKATKALNQNAKKTTSLSRAVFNKDFEVLGGLNAEKLAPKSPKSASKLADYTRRASIEEVEEYIKSGAKIKKLAIVGLPNVGKSSLFNALNKDKTAITSDISGTTRDVKSSFLSLFYKGKKFILQLLDTGGFDGKDELFKEVSKKAIEAAKSADLVLFMVDGQKINDEESRKLFFEIKKPSILVINKIDNENLKENIYSFASFGAQEMVNISVAHRNGFRFLIDRIYNFLRPKTIDLQEDALEILLENEFGNIASGTTNAPNNGENLEENFLINRSRELENKVINVGIIGRVNVGKSSVLNALCGKNRSVVSAVAGTTIDPVDEVIDFDNYQIKFVDTAGIRRRSKIEGLEKFALSRTQAVLQKSDIALLVLDVNEGFVDLDEKISALINVNSLGVIVVLNKWDIRKGEYKGIIEEFRRKFKFLAYAPIICASALSLRNIIDIKENIINVYKNYIYKIPTSTLNNVLNAAFSAHPIPSDHGKLVKVYYSAQISVAPPKIAIVSNRASAIHFSYKRYLINVLRKNFDFSGVYLEIIAKDKSKTKKSESSTTN